MRSPDQRSDIRGTLDVGPGVLGYRSSGLEVAGTASLALPYFPAFAAFSIRRASTAQ